MSEHQLGRQGLIESQTTRAPDPTRPRQALVEVDEAQTLCPESTRRGAEGEAEDDQEHSLPRKGPLAAAEDATCCQRANLLEKT